MGQVLHGSAKTTHAVRALIQRSKASNAALSRELDVNVKTVAEWRKRDDVQDAAMGPKEAHSTVLGIEEEAVVAAFRRHTPLPPDDCLYALQHCSPAFRISPDPQTGLPGKTGLPANGLLSRTPAAERPSGPR